MLGNVQTELQLDAPVRFEVLREGARSSVSGTDNI